MLWIVLLLISVASLTYCAWRFGLLEKFHMQNGKLMACEILYLPYKGDYSKVGPLFEEVSRTTKTAFKFSQNFGFYFDDPSVTAPEHCRAIIGILVNEGQQFKIKQFLSNHKQYRTAHLPTTRYLSYEMPFVNVLSILLMIKTVYPKIQQYLKKEEINEAQISGMMELYKCVSSNKRIEIIVPLHNREHFLGLLADDDEKQKQHRQPEENHVEENKKREMLREQ